jgi:hypothetical protein
MQGHFAAQWTLLQHNINPKFPKAWISYTIQTIWYYVYNVWKFRCNVNHGTNSQDKRQRAILRLTPKLTPFYNKINEIDPADNNIFEKTQNEMLLLPTYIIENWIYKAPIRITDSIKRQKQKTRQTNPPIRNFLYRVIHHQHQIQQMPIPPQVPPQRPIIPQRNLVATTLGNFFQLRPPPAPDPHLHIPHNDDRPP